MILNKDFKSYKMSLLRKIKLKNEIRLNQDINHLKIIKKIMIQIKGVIVIYN